MVCTTLFFFILYFERILFFGGEVYGETIR
nr:MAG TPA: hypothetical protein [Caudoviricetes sp.]